MSKSLSFRELCLEYGISTKTGYKWKERFLLEGLKGLHDRSRRPKRSPHELREDVVCEIVQLKLAHKNWGPRKIRDVYRRKHRHLDLPSESSFKRVLAKAGLVEKRRRRRHHEAGRIEDRVEAKEPNDVWTVDFKGWWYTPDHERCEPLTVRDDFSRYVLGASLPEDARSQSVRREFEKLFARYGLPSSIRSDNGVPFASSRGPLGLSRLSVWWLALGIDLDRIRPGRPYENGGHERMHLDMARDLEGKVRGSRKQQSASLEVWRREFNEERPHESLGMRVPSEVYRPSSRPFGGTPDRLIYPDGYLERKVHTLGHISLNRSNIMISSVFRGWNMGLKPTVDGEYAVHFGQNCVGHIDLRSESFRTVSGWKGKRSADTSE